MILRGQLPVAPSLNHAYKTVIIYVKGKPSARRAKTTAALEHAALVASIVERLVQEQDFHPPLHSHFKLYLKVYFDQNGRDLDNVVKLTQDAVFSVLPFNDNRIDFIQVERMPKDPEYPRIDMELYALDPWL